MRKGKIDLNIVQSKKIYCVLCLEYFKFLGQGVGSQNNEKPVYP